MECKVVQVHGHGWVAYKWIIDYGDVAVMSRSYGSLEEAHEGLETAKGKKQHEQRQSARPTWP